MQVTKETERAFRVVMTATESKQLKVISEITSSCDSKVVEHLLSSGMFHAADSFNNLLSDTMPKEVDEDGNEIGP